MSGSLREILERRTLKIMKLEDLQGIPDLRLYYMYLSMPVGDPGIILETIPPTEYIVMIPYELYSGGTREIH